MKRKLDLQELLAEVDILLHQIDDGYFRATNNEDIIQVARPKVKSCLEHLRSCLDYIASDLSEFTMSPKTPYKVYFPYGSDKSSFDKFIAKNLPDIENKYRDAIESIQPHKSGSNWLVYLCQISDFNKHVELNQQDRINSDNSITRVGNLVQLEGGGRITIGKIITDGVHINPKGPLVITKDKPIREMKEEIIIDIPIERKYEWVKFILKGTSLDVRELLIKSKTEISTLVTTIYGS